MATGMSKEDDPDLPDKVASSGPEHLIAVADVLVELSEEIEELGEQLCSDPAIIVPHLALLQAIDLIAQKQRWLATLLLADCPITAVSNIAVDALRERLSLSNRPNS